MNDRKRFRLTVEGEHELLDVCSKKILWVLSADLCGSYNHELVYQHIF